MRWWVVEADLAWTAVGTLGTCAGLGLAWVQVRLQVAERRRRRLGSALPGVSGMSVAAPTGALPVEVRGRGNILGDLRRWARKPPGMVIVLVGLGGQGKTTLAAALAGWHRSRRGKRPVWWVSAADRSSLTAGLVTVARWLGASPADLEAVTSEAADAPDRVWALLEGAPAGWLLIFDNADDPSVLATPPHQGRPQPGDGRGWLRSSRRGLVLVTSRDTDPRPWGGHARVCVIPPLSESDAALVLGDLAPHAGDQAQARALARRLGCLALALHLAGISLNSPVARWRTFTAYRRAFEAGEGLGRLDGTDAEVNPRAVVMRTWEISLDDLARAGVVQARALLRLLSCYASATPIPYDLLAPGLVAGLLHAGRPPAAEEASRLVEQAVEGLCRFGLVESRPHDRHGSVLVVHPLVADTNRAHLAGTPSEHAQVGQIAVGLITAAITRPGLDRPQDWPGYRLLEPHLHAVFETVAAVLDRAHLTALLDSARTLSEVLRMSGATAAGESLCHVALSHAPGRDRDRVGLSLKHELGRLAGAQGRWAQAQEQYSRLLPELHHALGADHPTTLALRHDLAWVTAMLGHLQVAEEMFRGVLHDRRRMLGDDDRGTVDSRHEIAWVAAAQFRWAEAEEGYRQVLEDRRRLLGEDHPDTLITEHELAWSIAGQGRLDEAETAHRQVLRTRRRVLGEEHPRTLDTRHELAWVAARQGRWAQAEEEYRQVLRDRQRALGDNHPTTLITAHELAWSIAGQGRLDKAETALREVLRARRRVLGDDHPDTQATVTALEELRLGGISDTHHLT